jgi:hypothetical protein
VGGMAGGGIRGEEKKREGASVMRHSFSARAARRRRVNLLGHGKATKDGPAQ